MIEMGEKLTVESNNATPRSQSPESGRMTPTTEDTETAATPKETPKFSRYEIFLTVSD